MNSIEVNRIEYRFPEEKDILRHYAILLEIKEAEQIINKGYAGDKKEAEVLTSFYWSMVDKAVEDNGEGVEVLEKEGVEAWMEYIFHSINGYMVSNGYSEQWDKE